MISDVALEPGGTTAPGVGAPTQLYDLSWRRFQAFAGRALLLLTRRPAFALTSGERES